MPMFTYVDVTSLTPKIGPTFGGTAVTITGYGFSSATGVTFDGLAATAFVSVSNTKITCTTPAHASGAVDVVVVGVSTLANGFAYEIGPPSGVASLLPPLSANAQLVSPQTGSLTGDGIRYLSAWKTRIENPILSAGSLVPAENVVGVLSVSNIPSLPFTKPHLDASPRLLGRSSAGAGAAEEITVLSPLVLQDGLLGFIGALGGFTQGSILFAGVNGYFSQNNANLFWDDTNHRLGIWTNTPSYVVDVSGTLSDAFVLRVKNASTAAGNVHASLIVENSAAYGQLFKAGTGYSGYKNIAANDLGFFNNAAAGNISILNDTGNVNIAANGAATPMVTVTSAGLGIGTSSLVSAHLLTIETQPGSINVLRWRNGDNPRYRGDVQISASGLQLNAFDDTGVVTLPMSYLSSRVIFQVNAAEGLSISTTGFTAAALLHLGPGTATASTAPLKFTSGTLLSTPEAGAIEFLTDKFYATITTGAARKQFVLESLYASSNGLTMATARLLGRTTAATGAAEEISVAGDLTLSGGVLTGTAATTTAITDDTTTNATMYPVWVTANTGNLALKVTSTKLSFNPSTGLLTATSMDVNTTSSSKALNVEGAMSFLTSGTVRGFVGPPTWDNSYVAMQNATISESASNLAIAQDAVGNTIVNAASGKSLSIRIANSSQVNVTSSALEFTNKATKYNAISTAGWGLGAIYGSGRATAQTAAVASVAAYTVGGSDGSFDVAANVLVTTSTTHNFTVTCTYTDEGGTSRTVTFNFSQVAGTIATAITNGTGAGPYDGLPLRLRCKASTAITIATTGTFTTVTYNVEGTITQVS